MQAPIKRAPGRPANEGLRERRHEEILDAAAALFAKHGYPDTDVQFVADALGLSKGTIYRYFPSKQELFLAAVDRGMCRLGEEVEAGTARVEDGLERIARGIELYLGFFKAHPEYAELLIQERAQFKDRQQQTYFVHQENNIGPWRELICKLVADGRVRDVPVERITDVLSDLVYRTMFTNYFSGRHKPLDTQAQDIIDIVFHGILSDAERARSGMRMADCTGGTHATRR
jgi:AcrR family transcriptional regulator